MLNSKTLNGSKETTMFILVQEAFLITWGEQMDMWIKLRLCSMLEVQMSVGESTSIGP